MFYLKSPKREGLLRSIVKRGVPEKSKRKPILDLCATRWAERHTAYMHFYQSFTFTIKSLELMAHGRNSEDCDDEYIIGWDPSSKQHASALLTALASFDFIVKFITVSRLWHYSQTARTGI